MDARLWYVNVYVSDFARAVAFYRDTLGLPLQMRDDAFSYASFATEGARFSVAKADPGSGLVGRHTGVGLGVRDLPSAYEQLRSKGVQFTMLPREQPWGGFMAMFQDPDGNIFFLDQLRPED